jgi:hypothetical protein
MITFDLAAFGLFYGLAIFCTIGSVCVSIKYLINKIIANNKMATRLK